MQPQLTELTARIDRLEQELAEQRDRNAIEAALTRYCRGLDWLDVELADEAFFADAEIDYGLFKGTWAEFRGPLMALEKEAGRRWHFCGRVAIALRGDIADVESYALTVSPSSAVTGGNAKLLQFCGYYLDRFEKRQGRWAIARRKYLLVGCASIDEAALGSEFEGINRLIDADPAHSDYRKLTG